MVELGPIGKIESGFGRSGLEKADPGTAIKRGEELEQAERKASMSKLTGAKASQSGDGWL